MIVGVMMAGNCLDDFRRQAPVPGNQLTNLAVIQAENLLLDFAQRPRLLQ